MQYIKNSPMTVDEFLSKLEERTSFSIDRDGFSSSVKISFLCHFTWGDGSEKISDLILDYDPATENISKITIIGSNLVQILGYTYMNEQYLWFTIKDIRQFDFEHIEDTPGILVLNIPY